MSHTFAVVWDGRRDGPGGAHLLTPEEVRVIPERRPPARRAELLSWVERLEVVRDVDRLGYDKAGAKWELTPSALYSIVWRVRKALNTATGAV